MIDVLIQIFLGWPAMILSLVLALVGVAFKKPVLSTIGAAVLLPPAWYLSHYSPLFWLLPLFLFGAAYAVSKGKNTRAVLFVLPALAGIAWLAFIVLTQ